MALSSLNGVFTLSGPAAATAMSWTMMTSTMLPIRWSWQKLFSYGEVVCFVSAWAVGLLIAMQGQGPDRERIAAGRFAVTSDALGMQATLSR